MRTFLLCLGLAAAGNARLNPVTRVAELLEGLSKKVETDGKAEQELYDQYKCWCTKVTNAKAASMEANRLRINELAAYIDDLSNGRVELTSERATLEAEIKELEKAIATEEGMRAKEKEDYDAAHAEMTKSIDALTQAVQVLGDGTADSSLSSLSSKLKRAMTVGEGFLAKRDVSALKKALDVPEVDWKKLNRDATFKQKYKASSGKIQDILADMLSTFTDNRSEAEAAETKAASDYDALMTSKQDQLRAAKEALLDKAGEKGARAEALAESEAEKSDLEGQNERDQVFYDDTKAACADKAEEWAARKGLRAAEIASISQAIGILRSDDARDLFKKSFDSQSFLQVARKHDSRRSRALALLRSTAIKSKDMRLAALSTTFAAHKGDGEVDEANPFVEVLAAVDKMVADLKAEEADDLAKKEQCESDRTENTQEAKVLSKKIDTNTETIDRLAAEVAEKTKQIEAIDEETADLTKQKQEAADQRTKAAAEHASAKSDDQGAVALIEQAVKVLKDFYTNNDLALVQKRAKQEPFVEAGEAPTPPPSTWDAPYGGAKGENDGIVGILELIGQDIEKDIGTADTNEAKSISEHEKFNADVDANLQSLADTKADLEDAMATAMKNSGSEDTTRSTNQGDLDATIDLLKQMAPGCDFIAVNFQTRKENRQAEVDGLGKAKAILEGADFGL